jgi:hypothetical protein
MLCDPSRKPPTRLVAGLGARTSFAPQRDELAMRAPHDGDAGSIELFLHDDLGARERKCRLDAPPGDPDGHGPIRGAARPGQMRNRWVNAHDGA